MTRILMNMLVLLCVAAQAHAELPDSCVHLEEITVTGLTGSTNISRSAAPVSVVSPVYLRTHQSMNIIDAISRQPGVAQITTGGGISKPVIRGLGYNRVLVVADGVRQEGQQWGDEHGVETDAQSVNSVEIQRGPASLMYGSDAMAGVVILHSRPLMPPGEMRGEVTAGYQTNNGLFDYSASFEGNRGGVVWNWRYSEKMAHDYKNSMDGYVANSRFHERAVTGMAGIDRTWGRSLLRLSYYHLTPGIVGGGHNHDHGDGDSHGHDHEEEAIVEGGTDYGKMVPFQQVRHYKVVSDNTIAIGEGALKVIAAYQHNRRQEYEESAERCGLDFMLHTVNYDVRYTTATGDGWKVNVGTNGMYQRSINKGTEFLIPSYNLFDIGLFATATKSLTRRLHLSGGLRYDTRHLHSHPLEDGGEERFTAFSRNYSGLTGSIGAVYNLSEHMDARLNLSRGYRAPNLSEMGSNGVHEGTARYERGDNSLRQEFSWQADAGIDYSAEHLSAQLSLFANHIDNYIYLSRTGEYLSDNLPVYRYSAGDARIVGGEARVIVHPLRHLHFENTFSYVNAVLLHRPADSRYLPFTPAPRWLSALHYDIKGGSRSVKGMFVEVEMDCNLRQTHVYSADDTETATPSYTLFNISAGTDIVCHRRTLCSLCLTATNIFDRTYQSHLSRLKYVGTNPATGRSGMYNMGRNIGMRVTFFI